MAEAERMIEQRNVQMCVYCGVEAGTTRDHVPPKSIFPPGDRKDLVTVPACEKCNGGASSLDEEFKAMLNLKAGSEHPASRSLWDGSTLRGIKRNRRFLSTLRSRMLTAHLEFPNGEVTKNQRLINWGGESHDRTVERIARGLHFHDIGAQIGRLAIEEGCG
ncbi:hypothetical protein [Azospirillum griseum]|uniref:HNH endonuclease n=1 Tax=Azospirillum griseum TaxID=2496639 RepID=A0A3S0JZU2_9PROT|nr:hypothetical protein [Azospirillum griseum]RTR11617.1 hypothetical protein EJ903_26020 [Azospirillum griseum]